MEGSSDMVSKYPLITVSGVRSLLASMQAHHLGDDVAPNAAQVRRIDLRAQPQPAVQAI
jgi:hypothetical protein